MQAIVAGRPQSYEQAWRAITRDYRLLTRGLVLATAAARRRGAPLCRICVAAPAIFRGASTCWLDNPAMRQLEVIEEIFALAAEAEIPLWLRGGWAMDFALAR